MRRKWQVLGILLQEEGKGINVPEWVTLAKTI